MILVLSGIGGTGKDELIRHLVPLGFRRYAAFTTRPVRPTEKHGVDYRFVTDSEMDALLGAGEMLDVLSLRGHRYASPLDDFRRIAETGEDVVLHLAPFAAHRLRKAVANVRSVYLLAPSMAVLRSRMVRRGMTSQEVDRRLELDPARCINVLDFDLFVVNEEGRASDAAQRIISEFACLR